MNWQNLLQPIAQIAIFSIFISSSIEVIKGVSAIGIKQLLLDLWKTLWHNEDMKSESFPVLNFAIALLFCWSFNITLIQRIFDLSNLPHQELANFLDYFGTASVTYLGSDQFFKRIIDAKKSADETIKGITS